MTRLLFKLLILQRVDSKVDFCTMFLVAFIFDSNDFVGVIARRSYFLIGYSVYRRSNRLALKGVKYECMLSLNPKTKGGALTSHVVVVMVTC